MFADILILCLPFSFPSIYLAYKLYSKSYLGTGTVQSRKYSISIHFFEFFHIIFLVFKIIFSTQYSNSLQSKSCISILYIRLMLIYFYCISFYILKESSYLCRCQRQSLAFFQFTFSLTLKVNFSSLQCALSYFTAA